MLLLDRNRDKHQHALGGISQSIKIQLFAWEIKQKYGFKCLLTLMKYNHDKVIERLICEKSYPSETSNSTDLITDGISGG